MAKRSQSSADVRGHGCATEGQRAAALGALWAAQSDADAAKAAGVAEGTLRRWKREDVAFARELAEGLEAVKRANIERGAGLLGKAIGVLARALDGDDVPAALGVFRVLSAQKLEHSGPGGGPIATVAIPKTREEIIEELRVVRARIDAELGKEPKP